MYIYNLYSGSKWVSQSNKQFCCIMVTVSTYHLTNIQGRSQCIQVIGAKRWGYIWNYFKKNLLMSNCVARRNRDLNLGGAKVLCSKILKSSNINNRGWQWCIVSINFLIFLYFSKSIIDIYNKEFCKLIGTFWYFQGLTEARPILYSIYIIILKKIYLFFSHNSIPNNFIMLYIKILKKKKQKTKTVVKSSNPCLVLH